MASVATREDPAKKRSLYRPLTTFGVPKTQFHTATTADVLAPVTTVAQPPPNNLTPNQGTMYQYKTEVQKQYKVFNIKPPEIAKAKDNLPIMDDYTEPELQRKRDDYSGYDYDRPANSKVSRPSDNLHPEDGTMKQYKTEAQKKFAPVNNYNGRSTPYKPGSQIKSDGDIDFGTKKQPINHYDDSLSNKVSAPPDNLGPMEGTMSQYKTEAQKRYKAYNNVHPSEPIRREDQFDFEHDEDLDYESEHKKQYNGALPERATQIRPSTTMAKDGNIDWGTHNNAEYLPHDYSKQEKVKIQDNLKPFEGKLKDKSESKKQYDGRQGERTNKARPNTSMLREGDFDWETNKKSEYKEHQLSKQEILKTQDNLKPLQGKLKDKSESKKQYDGRQGERSNNARPNTAMLTEGDFNWETNKNSEYKEHKLSKQEQIKAQDNLKPLQGKLKDKSESKKQYDGRQGERSNNARPNTAMLTEGDFNWETNKNSEYKEHKLSKQEQIKAQDNLKPFEGRLKDKSESKKQYDGRQGERSNKARPNTSMLREGDFDWETNKKSEFKEHPLTRQELLKAQDNLKPLEGRLKDKSESKKQYDGRLGERADKMRPTTAMLTDGDFDWETNKKADYKQHELTKQELVKAQDNLRPFEGKLKAKSESKKQFDGRQADRTNLARPNTSMLTEGDFNWETNKNSEFKQHNIKRQDLVKAQDNLKLPDGKLKSKTESKTQFTGQATERAQMARPGTTMLKDGDFDWNTRKTEDFRAYDSHQKPEKVRFDDNLGVPGKHAKLDGVSESKSTYKAHSSDLVSEGREPRQRGQKGNLALLDAPLEGMSESKSNYNEKAGHDISKAHVRPRPEGHLEVNKGSPFTQKNSTSNREYHTGAPSEKPQQQVRKGDNLRPNGGIETETEYKKSFDLAPHSVQDIRSQPGYYETLITPFGPYAEGQATRMGQQFQVQASV